LGIADCRFAIADLRSSIDAAGGEFRHLDISDFCEISVFRPMAVLTDSVNTRIPILPIFPIAARRVLVNFTNTQQRWPVFFLCRRWAKWVR
jgi:hypothetical protein